MCPGFKILHLLGKFKTYKTISMSENKETIYEWSWRIFKERLVYFDTDRKLWCGWQYFAVLWTVSFVEHKPRNISVFILNDSLLRIWRWYKNIKKCKIWRRNWWRHLAQLILGWAVDQKGLDMDIQCEINENNSNYHERNRTFVEFNVGSHFSSPRDRETICFQTHSVQ